MRKLGAIDGDRAKLEEENTHLVYPPHDVSGDLKLQLAPENITVSKRRGKERTKKN